MQEGLQELLDGIYPAAPEGEVNPEMAEKGIGAVPEWLWQVYVGSQQEYLLRSTEESKGARCHDRYVGCNSMHGRATAAV